ncbi:MAG TPA: DmsC/YnfH family molybdoenzyme membrane anchor subunit [Geminicoccaceae bacterium]|nr:DmsC/YnfH family molybdoenzyme membrane anchor subunit [Geminicoccaceae bacterium]
MHPAPSIIVFTTLSGAGYGLLFVLALGSLLGPVPAWPGLGLAGMALALGLVSAGLLSSTLHLGRPERAWRAVSQWRSSWLSREGVMALLTYLPALGLAAGWVLVGRTDGIFAAFALLAAAGAAVTVWCTGMIYASLKPIRQWHQPLVPPVYLGFALMTGSLLAPPLLAFAGAPHRWAGGLAVVATLLAWGLKALYWRAIGRDEAISTAESATGLGRIGLVGLLEPPHSETNYLLDEMAFRIGRRHARKLRRLSYGLGLGVALPLTLLAALAAGQAAGLIASLAAIAGMAGVAIERWLFFAEARHTVRLYYRRRAA